MVSIVLMAFWLPAIFFMLPPYIRDAYLNRSKKKGTVEKPPKFSTKESANIYNKYQSLDDEFKTFPELASVLLLLDEKTMLNGRIEFDHIVHSAACSAYAYSAYGYTNTNRMIYFGGAGKVQNPCGACKPYMELLNSVNALQDAQDDRRDSIEEKVREAKLADIDFNISAHQDLAERMRREARIVSEVTKEVY